MFVLNLQLYGHEHFFALACVRTAVANQFISEAAIEQIFHHLLFLGSLDQGLNSIDKHIEEFVYILLDSRVDWTTVNVFESGTKFLGVVILLFEKT